MPEKKYYIEEIYKVAAEGSILPKLLDGLREGKYVKDDNSFVEWWYTNNKELGKSPDDFCKEGKQEELESLIMGVFMNSFGS